MKWMLSLVLFVCLCPGTATAIQLPTGFENESLIGGFAQPMTLAFLPDGRILVAERNGMILVVSSGLTAMDTVLAIPDVLSTGEAGCSGLAVDPRWPTKPFIYIQYNRDPLSNVQLVRYTGAGDLDDEMSGNLTFGDRFVVLGDIPDETDQHNGGCLRFGPDDMLYSSLGDDVLPSFCSSQDSTTMTGVLLRLNVTALPDTGSGPADKGVLAAVDNPWAPDTTDAALGFCMGLRNPYRFSIDSLTGRVYIGDVGATGFEEINQSSGGENFAWPLFEGPLPLFPMVCGGVDFAPVAPIAVEEHAATPNDPLSIVCGPLYRVTGWERQFPAEYDGRLFQTDFFGYWIRIYEETLGTWALVDSVPGQPDSANWATDLGLVSDMIQGPDGGIYYLRFDSGEVHRINSTTEVGITETPVEWRGLILSQAPNPVRSDSPHEIRFAPGGQGVATLDVFSVTGSRVRQLTVPATAGVFRWNVRSDSGTSLGSGAYYLRLTTPQRQESTRIVVLR